jgi:hypothetical protein
MFAMEKDYVYSVGRRFREAGYDYKDEGCFKDL